MRISSVLYKDVIESLDGVVINFFTSKFSFHVLIKIIPAGYITRSLVQNYVYPVDVASQVSTTSKCVKIGTLRNDVSTSFSRATRTDEPCA